MILVFDQKFRFSLKVGVEGTPKLRYQEKSPDLSDLELDKKSSKYSEVTIKIFFLVVSPLGVRSLNSELQGRLCFWKPMECCATVTLKMTLCHAIIFRWEEVPRIHEKDTKVGEKQRASL